MSKGLEALERLGNKEFREGRCILQINDTYEYDDIEKELKEKEKQDFILNLLKEIIRFNVLQPEVKETDNGYSFMTKVVLEVRRNLENQERQQLRDWILKECFPKEMEVLEIIKSKPVNTIWFTYYKDYNEYCLDAEYADETKRLTEKEWNLIKEEIVCQSEKHHY